jgi:membrane protein DedA with SNARE-associated domain
MDPITATLLEHGYAVLFAFVLLDQIGLPMPALPVLIAAGGLAGAGRLDPALTVGVVALAAILGDWVWYELGRRYGLGIVRVLCRIAIEPDSCVRSTQGIFARHGPRSLLVAKWIPGLQTVAPPLAGAAKMQRLPFFAYAAVGALLWSAVPVAAGYALRDQLGVVGSMLEDLGGLAVVLCGAGLALYVCFKVLQRHRLIRALRGARISPLELRDQLENRESVEVVDLRHPIDFASDPYVIPGARRFEPEELDQRHAEIPRDRDIVLYCT